MSQTLLLIRHGQASAGSANYDRLSDIGREQSRLLGAWWQQRGFAPAASFHGTLERQTDTATLTLEAASLNTHCEQLAGLDEYNHRAVDAHLGAPIDVAIEGEAPANFESMTYADYATVMRRWRDSQTLPESVEHWPEFAARGWDAVSTAARARPEAETLAFFTSGGIIATTLATVLGLDFEHCIDAIWRVRNASVTTLAFDGQHARLVEFNNITHLEIHHDPALVTLI